MDPFHHEIKLNDPATLVIRLIKNFNDGFYLKCELKMLNNSSIATKHQVRLNHVQGEFDLVSFA